MFYGYNFLPLEDVMLPDHTTKVPSLLPLMGPHLSQPKRSPEFCRVQGFVFIGHVYSCAWHLCPTDEWDDWTFIFLLIYFTDVTPSSSICVVTKARFHLSLWLNCIPLCVVCMDSICNLCFKTLRLLPHLGSCKKCWIKVCEYDFRLVWYSTSRWT